MYDKRNRDESMQQAHDALATNLREGFAAYHADSRLLARDRFAKIIQGLLATIVANLDDVANTDNATAN